MSCRANSFFVEGFTEDNVKKEEPKNSLKEIINTYKYHCITFIIICLIIVIVFKKLRCS